MVLNDRADFITATADSPLKTFMNGTFKYCRGRFRHIFNSKLNVDLDIFVDPSPENGGNIELGIKEFPYRVINHIVNRIKSVDDPFRELFNRADYFKPNSNGQATIGATIYLKGRSDIYEYNGTGSTEGLWRTKVAKSDLKIFDSLMPLLVVNMNLQMR